MVRVRALGGKSIGWLTLAVVEFGPLRSHHEDSTYAFPPLGKFSRAISDSVVRIAVDAS